MPESYEAFATRLTEKKTATPEDLALYVTVDEVQNGFRVGDKFVPLLALKEDDELDAEERQLAAADLFSWDLAKSVPECEETPDTIDRRENQTPVKNQLDRGTCVSFASLGAMEAMLLDQEDAVLDVSEQYAHWMFMSREGRNQCADGLRTTLAARYLSKQGVCIESAHHYEDRGQVEMHCSAGPSVSARAQASFGIGNYTIIERLGLYGPSIANTEYLECLISEDHDVVLGTHVAWGYPDTNGVNDVILDPYGNPLTSRGGHAMLIVGYDRSAPIPYFIVKNSWGEDDGNTGYRYLSHDYIRQYAKYGYIIKEVRTDMPTEPVAY